MNQNSYQVHDDESNVTGLITQDLIDECLNAKTENVVLRKTVEHLSHVLRELTAQPSMQQRYDAFYGKFQQDAMSAYWKQNVNRAQREYEDELKKYMDRMYAESIKRSAR
ncbi:MAG: hypothetical protein WC455_15280 [Dehalococcoidia bacterium]|jgi:hypothetical protein